MLSIQCVTKRYGDCVAIDRLSLEASSGSITGLLGPNGAGKTTAIRMILNIVAPDEGRITLFGQPFSDPLRDRIGYLPEERGLYEKMRVWDLLRFFAGIKGAEGPEAEGRISAWLKRLDLEAWRDHRVEALSKGMQQKLQFILTVAHDPDLIILDEPFAGLDPLNVDLLKDILFELRDKGKTILLSTHLMDCAERLCDRICLINQGRMLLCGILAEIQRDLSGDSGGKPALNDIFLKVVKAARMP